MSRPADPHARTALITAARKAFWKQGIRLARIEDITASCGLSKGAFYLHFESKESLFGELVNDFSTHLRALFDERLRAEQAFLLKSVPGKRRDAEGGAVRLRALEAVGREHDRSLFDYLWQQRDIAHVLLNGAQGTEFDGFIWQMVDAEVKRVGTNCDRLKKWGLCRRDIPSEIIGSMLIGSWLLLLRRMVTVKEKPDVDAWLVSLSHLLTDGISPVATKRPSASLRVTAASPRTKLRSVS